MQCNHCGEKLSLEDTYCPECGRKAATHIELDLSPVHKKSSRSSKERHYNVSAVLTFLIIFTFVIVGTAIYFIYSHFAEERDKLYELQRIRSADDTPSQQPTVSQLKYTPTEPSVSYSGTVQAEIQSAKFDKKTLSRGDEEVTKYKVGSIVLLIENNKDQPVQLKGLLTVLDSQGNNAVSNNFIYKIFDVPEIKAGETYIREQIVNTAGDIRPYLTNINSGDMITLQLELQNTRGTMLITTRKTVEVK
ncbi:MAG TPA: zinc ribbon domain-containing protein [Candidatus Nanoarchaeia archaeon]|nr:zinc ribbon domain-containing protein [Candidatus Nanoarchaeia archaeon]